MRHFLELGRVLYHERGGLQLEDLVEKAEGDLYLLDLYPEQRWAKLDHLELDEEKCRRFLWIGDPPQSQAQRDRVTTKGLRYLVGQVPGALVKHPKLKKRLGHVVWTVGTGKHGSLLDLRGYRLEGAKDVPRDKNNPFWVEGGILRTEENITGEKPGEQLAETLERAWGVRATRGKFLLFSLALEGQAVAEWPEYREYLRELLLQTPFQGAKVGVCHGCGAQALVTPETAPFRYKFYITDKKNFAPGLVEGAFPKSLALCKECFASLLLGERFVKEKLEISFLGKEALVLPEGVVHRGGEGEGKLALQVLARRVERLIKQVQGLEKVAAWRDFLQRSELDLETSFLGFSLVFFVRKQASTKILEVVYEVPPTRVEALFQAMDESRWLGLWRGEVGGLGEWVSLLENGGYASATTVAVHLLGGVPLERGFILPLMLKNARRVLWESPQGSKEALERLALGAGWLWVLRRLGMLKPEDAESKMAEHLTEEYRKLFEEYGFGSLQAGLYLLGVALEMVGHAQAKESNYKKEPLLEILGWEGMNLLEVRHLAQQAVDRASHYLQGNDLARFLELVGMATDLMERGRERLSQREIPYYLLMGYAQARMWRFRAGKDKGAKEELEEVAHGE